MEQDEHRIHCPYCGEPINVLIDTSAGSQHYIEDCQVCCRPIEFELVIEATGEYSLRVSTDY